MFITLLVVTFVISVAVATAVVLLFSGAIGRILRRIVSDELSQAWLRYLRFTVYVVGISSGVRIWDLEKYITPQPSPGGLGEIIALTTDRWVLEVYRTVIGSLQGIAWMLLVFFAVALLAFVVVRAFELREPRRGAGDGRAAAASGPR